MLEGRRPTIFGDGHQTRDFVFVDDVCDAFLRAVDRGDRLLLNIGSGVETSVIDLYDLTAALLRYPAPPLYADARTGEVRRNLVDPSKAKRSIGWEPWTSLEDGLRKTVEWYRGR
jgi:UDP-glucose 4-epimerase